MKHEDTWWERAACRDVDPAIFEPPVIRSRMQKISAVDWSAAKRVCDQCPVIEQCFKEAVKMPPPEHSREELFVAGCTPGEITRLRVQYRNRLAARARRAS